MGLGRKVVAELKRVVGTDHVRTGRGDVEPYARDATPLFRGVPDLVVWPGTAAEIAAILRLATQRGIPVIPRGAGSNLCGATVAWTFPGPGTVSADTCATGTTAGTCVVTFDNSAAGSGTFTATSVTVTVTS